ncbi:MAG TPA: MATE family efflux transporter, partial [Nocardioidaceae bacterium]|nr:MATE family efflux transporter [Nocardioidaceae bacterium]
MSAQPTGPVAAGPRQQDREILRLAVPAFLALVAEPMFLLADAAIIGHLGTPELAGLGIAGAIIQTAVGLCVFLAYGTTASVARRIGAGDMRGALAQGIDGVWLAVFIGAITTALGITLTGPLVGIFQPGEEVGGYAATYLRWAFAGSIPLLVMLAATGILRGLQDTRTPLYVAVAGNLLNIALNYLLVYGVGLGIAGAAIGTDLAQLASAAVMVFVVVRAARSQGAPLTPDLPGVRRAAHAGVALVIRTLTLRASLLVTTYGAAVLGATSIATHQLALTLWTFLAFALDAIAIAAQAITGRYLGAGDVTGTRAVTQRMIWWGVISGVVTGLLLAASSTFLGALFTNDPAVRDMLWPVLLVAAVFQPIAGVVFVLDGVLIGAGDGRYLAWGGVVVLGVFAPMALLVARFGPESGAGLVWLWVTFGVGFMGSRALVLLHRARGRRWMVTGL